MKRHDLSAMFPDMPVDDFAKLVSDIRANGLLDPITLWNGEIVDGWHRYKACQKAGVEPRFVEFDGDDRKALAMVVSKNARRRHLSEGAIVGITKRVLGWHEAAAREGRRAATAPRDVVTESAIAEFGGLSLRTVQRHSAIERKAPALITMVERGDIGLATATAAARNAPVEVLNTATPAQIKAFAAASDDRLEVRVNAARRAARELREQVSVLSKLDHPDAVSCMFEVRLILAGAGAGLTVDAATR